MNQQSPTSTLTHFADLMDRRFTIPGTNIRYGIDAVIGLIPGIGDWVGGLVALYFPVHAAFMNVSAPVILRMFLNVLVDIVIGSVPVFGDLFDVSWKANVRNVRLLNKYQRAPQTTHTRSQWLIWSLVVFFVLIIILLLFFISWLIVKLFEFLF